MKVLNALKNRRSIRAFKPDPVPRKELLELIDTARWAPSWGNTQPWELVVVGGDTVKQLTAEFAEAVANKVPPNPDIPMPETFPEAAKNRYMTVAKELFELMGIAREDKASRQAHMLNMTRAFDAPNIIYVTFNGDFSIPYAMLDMGAIIHGLCLAAFALELGTCIEAQLALYPNLIRKYLDIPTTQKIVVGIALGYPDDKARINEFHTSREPVENLVRWVDC
ncbi:MAG: nitroreductase [Deltaproteobacteria bacterium]|nr:nitroreductase [Deltaproteobacteria bacterium]MBW1952349.1 nitroreductase [Deltaproteobacteria bacterium]MBW1986461.1 nitroreductase [Deltaproteobacteria bacterium]MBW2135435.1 nitroreductase [Deltaproteobacteria bacterium]